MIAVDTNLLVYAHRAGVPQHAVTVSAFERMIDDSTGWGIPFPCLAEFWSVVTHPACVGGSSTTEEAATFLLRFLEDGGGVVWQAGAESGTRLIQLARQMGVTGARIFDLQISLAAVENGATEIWSHDRNFVAVPGLAVVDPLGDLG